MDRILNTVKSLEGVPTDSLVLLVALGALALAAFAIYAVHSLAKERKPHD